MSLIQGFGPTGGQNKEATLNASSDKIFNANKAFNASDLVTELAGFDTFIVGDKSI